MGYLDRPVTRRESIKGIIGVTGGVALSATGARRLGAEIESALK